MNVKKITFVLSLILLATFVFTSKVEAADKLIFDSTKNYLGACQLTDKSEWELNQDLNITVFQLWYSWNQGETNLPITVYREGGKFTEFTAVRSQCDPYQKQWCNADYTINKLFPKGKYSTKIPNARQCLKPNGTGTVRLYGNETLQSTPSSTESSPSVVTEEQPPVKTQPVAVETKPTVTQNIPVCNYLNAVIITAVVTAIITFILSFTLFSLLRKRV